MLEQLRAVPLFAELSEADLGILADSALALDLGAEEILFSEGDEGDRAYIIREGELEVVKITGDREVLIAVRKQGEVIGEMALIDAAPRMASVRARGPASLLAIPKACLDELLENSPTAVRALFGSLLSRWRETESHLRQSERMAQLGTLTAGLAHELNNPASAVKRGADQLSEAFAAYGQAVGRTSELGLDAAGAARLSELMLEASGDPAPLDALERSDREAAVEDALTDVGAAEPWRLASELVAAGYGPDDLASVAEQFGRTAAPAVLEACAAAHQAFSVLRQVEEGATRLSTIVGALKSYSYLDQAPEQEVDVREGLDDTLLILRPKLGDVAVERVYPDDVPLIPAFASELNQVWTNLLDNAIHAAVEGAGADATIVIRVSVDGEFLTVDIEDNGTGIPADIQDRVFDAFFTTKPPGTGTGLGLDISYSIVVHKHRGEVTFESEPGRTVFRVQLPRAAADR